PTRTRSSPSASSDHRARVRHDCSGSNTSTHQGASDRRSVMTRHAIRRAAWTQRCVAAPGTHSDWPECRCSATPIPSIMVETTSPAAQLEHKIRTRTATVGVVGLGYVGLPLLRAFFQAGFPVVGYDIDQQKVDLLKR